MSLIPKILYYSPNYGLYPTWLKIWEFDKVGATYLKKRSGAEGLGVPENAPFLGQAVATQLE